MFRASRHLTSMVVCCSLAGCAGMPMQGEGQQQFMGAAGGAAAGCGLGYLIGGDAKDCVYGALAGAAAGWGAVKLNQYHANQTRSASQDQRLYGYRPREEGSANVVKIRKGSANPKKIKRGGTVNVTTDYSVMTPQGIQSVEVEETTVLKKDGQIISTVSQQREQREAGGWTALGSLPVPRDAQPGTYVIEHKIQTGTSYDVTESTFVVAA
jgi:hypothetical protein